MKYSSLILLPMFAMIFTGCPARSMNSLFTDDETIFNPALLGTWISEENALTFAKSEGKTYRAVFKDVREGDSLVYIARLGKIGEMWFIDSYPAEDPKDDHLLPAHMINKIWFDKSMLHIATLESDWLKTMIEGNRLKIPHIRRGNAIILTASTATLQQLALKFGNNKEAFPANGKPYRRK